ncbi:FecR family protein [Herbaspirillum sp. RV1423]|uniref:FecR family protein n=1 Tax=Herbaspirillum sp. RV1423 TaxID=1443993 RepID=UPI0004AD26AA|nr:FecR domain-containing protein [Herbaspirillum sp. RV1423]
MKRDIGADTATAADTASTEEAVAEQAAQWIVQLSADDEAVRAAARSGFDAWKKVDPRHADMAARLQGFIGCVQGVRGADGGQARPAHAALDAAFDLGRKRTRRAGIAIVAAMLLGLPMWLALKAFPPAYLTADMRTATGKWENRVLEDGTSVTLNSASAVNLHYDAKRRVLELVRGEILVEVARDPGRPFVVETAHGRIRALGTRFVVSREADATVLSMLESRVEVRTADQIAVHDEVATVVNAGQRVRIHADRVGPPQDIDVRSIADAWKFHQLVVQNQRLPDVLDALDRYRPGAISYDRAQIEDIRVSAVLPLDDTGRALQLLSHSFPALRIRMLSPYLVRVDAPVRP